MTLFLRLLSHDDKPAALADATAAVRDGQRSPDVFAVDPESFEQVPGSPFAYWVSESILESFAKFDKTESNGRVVRVSNETGDDFRFMRLWMEVPSKKIGKQRLWVPHAKGGPFSLYHHDLHLLIAWDDQRQTICGYYGRPARPDERIASTDFFFRPGLTYPRRTDRFSVRVMSSGCVFSNKGVGIFAKDDNYRELFSTLAIMNSSVYNTLIRLQSGRDALAQSFEVGVIQNIPIPNLSDRYGARLVELAEMCFNLKRDLDRTSETSHVFHLPALLQVEGETLAARATAWTAKVTDINDQLAAHQREIDDIAFKLYRIEGNDRRAIEATTDDRRSTTGNGEDAEAAAEAEAEADVLGLVAMLVSYLAGCAFGRWDIRFATGEKLAPELPDPFAPLPVCSPGMLTGDDGLPLREAPTGYPIHLDPDGILVDDPEHPDDIVRRVREVLDVIFGTRAEAIERETYAILGVGELRDYFRRPGNSGFWMDHVRRYSKSRRKAPIYWLLQSPKRNYALWLYYHRLDKDILFKAQVNYVEPKIRLEQERLAALQDRKKTAGTPREQRQIEREIEKQEVLLSDLHDFRDRLARAAKLYVVPDLNDGVVLNIAPLWELAPWKEARQYWDELLTGKYEWSSIGRQLREKGHVK